MASAPSNPAPVRGRVDRDGRLVQADPELEALQRHAGSSLGKPIAMPQVAAVASLARKLGIPVARPALAASDTQDFDLWVRATPEGDEVALAIEGWSARPAPPPRLGPLVASAQETPPAEAAEWATDEELKVTAISPTFAKYLGVTFENAAGQPLTRLLKLEEDADGAMPLISAAAGRRAFSGQRAVSRKDASRSVTLMGDVAEAPDGSFAGFRGTADIEQAGERASVRSGANDLDDALDQALRAPLDRIIASAERITNRADGPLRSDYAGYGTDIAAAARHLASVIQSMGQESAEPAAALDLAALAAEAVVLLEAAAEERGVTIALSDAERLPANGEERAVIQILVNLVGNAVRHSPGGGAVTLRFLRTAERAAVTVSDQGPGVAPEDQQRIFERFERAHGEGGGTGLGLAISRRLARAMGGDVSLESRPGEGASFTLTLPAA